MTPSKALPAPAWWGRIPVAALGEMAVPLAVLAIVIALITPLPGFVLDLLIVADILMSVTVLMVSLYLIRPVEFSSFPTTLLLLTLYRLALNISSSRRQHRDHRGRRSDRGFWKLRGRRELHHRRRNFSGFDRDPVRRDQPRRGAHFGGHCALYPGRVTREADVHRLGSQRRPDR